MRKEGEANQFMLWHLCATGSFGLDGRVLSHPPFNLTPSVTGRSVPTGYILLPNDGPGRSPLRLRTNENQTEFTVTETLDLI